MGVSVFEKQLAVRDLPDLIGLVPYLLGFHPQESLVAVIIESDQVRVTARVDLAAVGTEAELKPLLDRLFERFPAAVGWFLAFTDEEEWAWAVLRCCAELTAPARLGRCVQVGVKRWRADDPAGPAGRLGAVVSATAAHATVLGLPARASRAELSKLIAGPSGTEPADLSSAAPTLPSTAMDRRGRLRELLELTRPLSEVECRQLAELVQDDDGQSDSLAGLESDNAGARLERWVAVAQRCPFELRAKVLGQLGMAAWQTGDGALQVVCLEELERLRRDDELGLLLAWLNQNVVAPWEWPQLKGSVLAALRSG